MSHFYSNIFSVLFALASIFLIFIVLLQRGRGGGLAGAFGATGGQSAFGTKAGDVFTRITIGIAVAWVALAAATTFAMRAESTGRFQSQTTDEGSIAPVAPTSGAGGSTSPFEAGDNAKKTSPATKGTTAPKGSTPAAPAKTAPATKTTEPTKPAADAKGSPAPPSKQAPPAK